MVDFFLEYYLLIIPVLIFIVCIFIDKKDFLEEEKFLRAGGLTEKNLFLDLIEQ